MVAKSFLNVQNTPPVNFFFLYGNVLNKYKLYVLMVYDVCGGGGCCLFLETGSFYIAQGGSISQSSASVS
jgi:hypothetical protein